MVRSIHTYNITPALPDRLARLQDLAYNLWWTWDHEASSLFRRLDRDLWEQAGHNPVRLLGTVDQQRLLDAAQDEGYLTQYDHVLRRFDDYMANARPWYSDAATQAGLKPGRIAYFCMEFGLGECLPIYSGGMGVLAGDHLKSASELGLPLVGVGLLYQEGYFQQYLNADGWQQERYPDNDFANMPADPGAQSRPVAPDHPGQPAGPHGHRPDLEGPGGPRAPLPAGHQHAGQHRARRPRHHRSPLRRRLGHAHPPGDRAGHRRRARPGGPGAAPRGHPHERGPQRLPGPGAHSPAHGGEPDLLCRSPRAGGRQQRLHHPHARPRRHRPLLRRPDGPLLRRLRPVARLVHEGLPGPGPPEPQQRGRAVQHGRAGHPPGQRGERRQQAPRHGRPEDVAGPLARRARGRGAHPVHHQRHPPLHLGGAEPGRALRALHGRPLAQQPRPAPLLGGRRADPRRGAVAPPRVRPGAAGGLPAPAAARTSWRPRAPRRRRSPPPARR